MGVCLALVGPAGLSSDSGLGGSTDGSTDILVFGSVVDSVTEEGKRMRSLNAIQSKTQLYRTCWLVNEMPDSGMNRCNH